MGDIKFKIAAKTDSGLVRTNNEDNFQAASDLNVTPMKWVNDAECTLGDKGALLVVADGMGGMNAGEVASEIAIETVKSWFSPKNITEETTSSDASINVFMKKAIIEADQRIKKEAKENSAHKGMGTTIVITWLIKDKLYVAWCGDSRAYIFNKTSGLRQITKDHSYVQTLVDKHKIKPEDAFDFPDSNIITRSLSDSSQKARPDVIQDPITVCNGDVILLCTDGLNGMIRNHEIEQVLMENEGNMSECANSLIKSACEAAGEDNVTVALCKIVSGCSEPTKEHKNAILPSSKELIGTDRISRLILPLFIGALSGFYLGYSFGINKERGTTDNIIDTNTTVQDTVSFIEGNELKRDSVTVVKDEELSVTEQDNQLVTDKEDTTHSAMQNNVVTAIEETISRNKDPFNVMRVDSSFAHSKTAVSGKVTENDTLKIE